MKTSLEILPDLLHVSEPYDGILLDAYGVYWGGNACGLLPGAKETMQTLVSQGKILVSSQIQLS